MKTLSNQVSYIIGSYIVKPIKVKHNKFNYNNLEEGIHEFRRRLRWIGIYSSALNGKVIIDKYILLF